MAVPVTVLRLGPDDDEALVAEWYRPDGAAVRKGEPVYRLETDFAAIEVEAEDDGVLRHRAEAGTRHPAGEVIAFIAPVGEVLPGDEPPPTASDAPLPKARPRGDRRGAYPLAEVLRAAAEEVSAAAAVDQPEGMPWEAIPEPESAPDEYHPPAPVLLFPRIVSELKEQAEHEAELESSAPEIEMAEEPEPPTRIRASAWDLVPGENDFNPDWIMDRNEIIDDAPERDRSRFQASKIRSLALGRGHNTSPTADAGEGAAPTQAPSKGDEALVAVEAREAAAPESVTAADLESATAEAPRADTEVASARASPPSARVAPTLRAPLELPSLEQRAGYVPGPSLGLRVTVDMGEAAKMRDQLTREWWGSNVRPTDEDIVLRAIARALNESAAFRRRTDVVGMRPLAGSSRTVHMLGDAATRPFRDAVASLAALRETPGADVPCVCTLTSFAEFDLDEAMPALPLSQPLAFAMGSVRDVARYRGDKPYRAQVMVLTLAYDSDAMPDGAAARLLSRVRELVEAPYALLAD